MEVGNDSYGVLYNHLICYMPNSASTTYEGPRDPESTAINTRFMHDVISINFLVGNEIEEKCDGGIFFDTFITLNCPHPTFATLCSFRLSLR